MYACHLVVVSTTIVHLYHGVKAFGRHHLCVAIVVVLCVGQQIVVITFCLQFTTIIMVLCTTQQLNLQRHDPVFWLQFVRTASVLANALGYTASTKQNRWTTQS